MLSLGLRILGDQGEAEELLHDVFIEVWKRAGDYDPSRGSVRTWLMLRMRSRCLDRVRSAARSRTMSVSEEMERAAYGEPARASEVADARRVHGALAELPEAQRQVLELGYFSGLSCSEIAEVLGVPLGTVKSRLHAALKKLRVTFRVDEEKP